MSKKPTCLICGKRGYIMHTVIGKDGKKRTYCDKCYATYLKQKMIVERRKRREADDKKRP